eukprot:s9_g23.t1
MQVRQASRPRRELGLLEVTSEASAEPAGPSGKRAASELVAAGLEDVNLEEQLLCEWQSAESTAAEVLVAAHINKRAAKEIPAVNNPQELQVKVDEAKLTEWNTLLGQRTTAGSHNGK